MTILPPQVPERLEVRLDPERRRKLAEMKEKGAGRISEITRRGIDLAYEEFMRDARLAIVDHMAELNVENPPEPGEMNRQLAERYGPVS